jgi:nuclear pore complex protein Nup93
VSTASALRDLNNFSTQTGGTAQQGSAAPMDTDLDTFVSNLRTQSTMELIEEGLAQSKRDFDNFLEENVQMNWDAQRRKIYEHFGLKAPGEGSALGASKSGNDRGAFGASLRQSRNLGASGPGMSFGASGMKKSVLGSTALRSTLRANGPTDGGDKTLAPPQVGPEERANRDRMEKYATKVTQFNESRSEGICYPVAHQFAEVEREASEANAESLTNAYKALIEMVEEQSTSLPKSDSKVHSRERHFMQDYLNENPKSAGAGRMRERIINGSRKCLEKLFWERLTSTIEKDPKTANLGGIPQAINKVRAFIRIMAQRKNLLVGNGDKVPTPDLLQQITFGDETDYCWVLIFYLLRCGLVSEAARYVADNQRAMRSLDRNFSKYMEAYASAPDRKLPAELRNELLQHYRGKITVSPDSQVDPYMLACYKIIGRADLSRKTLDNVPTNEEDWIWLQFALARDVDRTKDTQGESFGLEHLQEIVKDIEQRHFGQGQDSSAGYGIFFFLQILAGMFEQAVALLYNHNHVAAVHFSIALSYYGLLRVANLSTGELSKSMSLAPRSRINISAVTYNTRQEPLLQFALMVGYYTGSFRAAKPDVASDYLTLLALNADAPGEAGKQQASICLDALRELVLETREFALLLGDIRNDGTRLPGAIQNRANLIRKALPRDQATDLSVFINTLTIHAAVAADENGRTTDAILLYHLAGEYDTVLTIINRTLSEALTVELGRESMRLQPLKPRDKGKQTLEENSTLSLTSVDDPVVLANNMYSLYTGANRQAAYNKIKPATRDATHLLIRMASAKQELLSRNFVACLETIGHINLLPLSAKGDITVIRQYAQNFNSLVPVLARCVGDLLIWAVLGCNGERERLLKDGWETDSRKTMIEQLGAAIADLGVFAGLVRYKLRQGVFEVLASTGDRN